MEKIVLVLTTVPEGGLGDQLPRTIIDRRLAACVSVLPSQVSTYRWQGAVEAAREHQVVIKTTEGQLEALHALVHEMHPYDLPEWLVIPVSGGDPHYLAWVARMGT